MGWKVPGVVHTGHRLASTWLQVTFDGGSLNFTSIHPFTHVTMSVHAQESRPSLKIQNC